MQKTSPKPGTGIISSLEPALANRVHLGLSFFSFPSGRGHKKTLETRAPIGIKGQKMAIGDLREYFKHVNGSTESQLLRVN